MAQEYGYIPIGGYMITDAERSNIEPCVTTLVEGLNLPIDTVALMQNMQKWVDEETDYLLRVARIAKLRAHLDELALASEQFKVIDLPLWYVGGEDRGGWHGQGSPTWLMLREDCDPDVMHFICKRSYTAQYAAPHPLYPAFYAEGYMIGNKATAPKKYIKATGLYNTRSAAWWKSHLTRHLGPVCWTDSTLPKYDVNDKYLCR